MGLVISVVTLNKVWNGMSAACTLFRSDYPLFRIRDKGKFPKKICAVRMSIKKIHVIQEENNVVYLVRYVIRYQATWIQAIWHMGGIHKWRIYERSQNSCRIGPLRNIGSDVETALHQWHNTRCVRMKWRKRCKIKRYPENFPQHFIRK